MKRIAYIVLLLLALALGAYGTYRFLQRSAATHTEQSATVLLEKIKTVAKLVTVEGYFTELYNYKTYWRYDWPVFRKKAILRVQAKVSVGFDLSEVQFDMRPEEQLLIMRNVPQDPEIISIDPEIDYYDLSEGTFNSFSEDDYNQLNRDARDFIEQKALESDLMAKAREQGIEILDVIRFMAENSGWQIRFETPQGRVLPPALAD